MFKKKISQEEFVDLLLEVRSEIEKLAIKALNEDFNYSGDKKKLQYEVMIFSLWLITLSALSKNQEIKDMLHSTFSWRYWGVEENEPLFKQIDKRYKNYYEAFNMWQKNSQSGYMIGTVIVETIKNQNPDFSLSEKIPTVGGIEALKATIIFGELFKVTLKMIGEIKKEYKIKNF